MPTVMFHPARLHGSVSVAMEEKPPGIREQGVWPGAVVLLCANALGSGVTVCGIEGDAPLSQDAKILSILRQMGLLAYEEQNEWHVTSPSRAGLMPIAANCADAPGPALLLALVLSQAYGRSALTGIGQPGGEERERLMRAQGLFDRLGARVSLSRDLDILTVEGRGRFSFRGGFTADAGGDPWIVLLLSVAALIADAPITVSGAEALDSLCPSYLEAYQSLGGKLRREDVNDC